MPKHHHHHHHQHHHYWHTLTGKPAPPLKLPATLQPPPPPPTPHSTRKPAQLVLSRRQTTAVPLLPDDDWLLWPRPLIWRTSSELASPILSDFVISSELFIPPIECAGACRVGHFIKMSGNNVVSSRPRGMEARRAEECCFCFYFCYWYKRETELELRRT